MIVVGAGKSAGDLATSIADVSSPVTMIQRTFYWRFPKVLGGIKFKDAVLNRYHESLLATYYKEPVEEWRNMPKEDEKMQKEIGNFVMELADT